MDLVWDLYCSTRQPEVTTKKLGPARDLSNTIPCIFQTRRVSGRRTRDKQAGKQAGLLALLVIASNFTGYPPATTVDKASDETRPNT